MKKSDYIQLFLGVLIAFGMILYLTNRKPVSVHTVTLKQQVFDSIKRANAMLLVKVGERDEIIGLLYNEIDSLQKLKSKIVYKTKYEAVIKNHDTCITYFDSCVQDLDICEQTNIKKDSIIKENIVKIDLLIQGNELYEAYSTKCTKDLILCTKDFQKSAKKVKKRNKVIAYLAGTVVLEAGLIYIILK